MIDEHDVGISDYRALAAFRYQIRRFLRFSEETAREAGIEPQQYLVMLAVKGLPEGVRGRVAEIAERLQLQHHSTVELVDRLEKQALVQRKRSPVDRREVLVSITTKGEKLLRELATKHKQQLKQDGPELLQSLRKVLGSSAKKSTTAHAVTSAPRTRARQGARLKT
jgi:DNA-binding MarR family transcriptional regulator